MKVCLLGATFNTHNLGVSALAAGVVEGIVQSHPDAQIVLLDYEKEPGRFDFRLPTRTIALQLVNMRFSKKLLLKNNIAFLIAMALVLRIIPSKHLRLKIVSKNDCLRQIIEADVILSIAGGDSFSDIYGYERFFYVSLPQLLVLLIGKKLTLLPQTFGPYNRRLVRAMARYIMHHADLIYSRDYPGLQEMHDFLKRESDWKKLRFGYDVAFAMEPLRPREMNGLTAFEEASRKQCVVGVNISGLLYIGGYNRKNMFGLGLDYVALIHAIIEFFITKKMTQVLLIPHVLGTPVHLESDLAACQKVFVEYKNEYAQQLFLVLASYNQNEMKYVIGLTDFFVGSRMHACIAALSQAVPAVAVAYSKKFYGVMQSIGFESLVADLRTMDQGKILDIIDRTYENRLQLSKRLRLKMPQVRKSLFNLFKSEIIPPNFFTNVENHET